MIHVLYTYLNETQHEALLKKYTDDCTIDFRQRLLKFRRWQDQQASLLGRVLLKKGIKELYGKQCPTITFGQYGKPYFETSDIQFNISHSHELVVCAITQHNEIGIDVEYPRSIDIQDFKFQMTEGEWNWISTAKDSQAAFYEYWTKKEAVIKAVGKGFSADLKSFDVMGGTKQLILEGQEWHLSEVAIDKNYHCYLAIAGIDYSVKWSRIQL